MKLKAVYRITTFVPPEHLDTLLSGILKVTPLAVGNYDQVVWTSSPGLEQFRPGPGSNPTAGSLGALEKNASLALVFSIPRDQDLLTKVLQEGLIANHPWEEPVIYVDEAMTTRTQANEEEL